MLIRRPSQTQRHALVIGNGNYSDAPLSNPANDAKDMAKVLTGLGFNVTRLIDANFEQMEQAIRDFGTSLRAGGVGLFYYAGHGVQVNNDNYLIPIGSNIERQHEVRFKAINAGQILAEMEVAENDLNLVFLEACRDNPFKKHFRSTARGLAQMQAPKGSLIAYATDPGKTAADGFGRNGTFTKYLLKHIQTPGMTIEGVLKQVRLGVSKETAGRQITWQHSSLMGDFFFVGSGKITLSPAVSPPLLGQISINSEPTGAKIYLDGYLEGRSPLQLSLRPGELTIEAKKQGYRSSEEKVRIRADRSQQVSLLLDKIWPAGETFRDELKDGRLGPEMVVIAAGSFRMGDIQGGGDDDEKPVHRVNIKVFVMGKTEVTFAEYDRFAEATGRKKPDDEEWGRGDRPVINVSWYDAVAYAKWLSLQTGYEYRLPSEAEWEYAARAGTTTRFSTGNCIHTDQANYDGNYDFKNCGAKTGIYRRKTLPVNQLMPNPWGLFHMHGNVREWVEDCWHDSYTDAPDDGSAWTTNCTDASRRVLRGGSWLSGPGFLRSANRDRTNTAFRWNDFGFRLARTF